MANVTQELSLLESSPLSYTFDDSLPRNELEIRFIKNRWLCVKTDQIVKDLIDMINLVGELERHEHEDPGVCNQIGCVILKLHGGYRYHMHMEVIHVIAKYLTGVKKFLSTTPKQGIIFYKKVLESTLIAIVREVESLEKQIAY